MHVSMVKICSHNNAHTHTHTSTSIDSIAFVDCAIRFALMDRIFLQQVQVFQANSQSIVTNSITVRVCNHIDMREGNAIKFEPS